jgi:hypothetical protein
MTLAQGAPARAATDPGPSVAPVHPRAQIFGRIRERGLPYWADPGRRRSGEINTNAGGCGVLL